MNTHSLLKTASLFGTLGVFASVASAQPVLTEDFSDPLKNQNTGANASLGTGGEGFPYGSAYGTWLYSAGNMGINEAAEGDGTGTGDGNSIDSTGMARVQDERGTNARAISVVYAGSNFSDGVTYRLSFDVVGDPLAPNANTGRVWVAAASGFDDSGSNYVQIDGTFPGWAAVNRPFVAHGSATVTYLTPDTAGNEGNENGAIIDGEMGDAVTANFVDFTYDATNSPDIVIAFGSYNAAIGIDNLVIDVAPATWGGYPITTNEDGSQWIDTGEWMGFLNIDNAPYLFSWELQSWIYFPEPTGEVGTGGWIYIFRN